MILIGWWLGYTPSQKYWSINQYLGENTKMSNKSQQLVIIIMKPYSLKYNSLTQHWKVHHVVSCDFRFYLPASDQYEDSRIEYSPIELTRTMTQPLKWIVWLGS